MPKELALTVTVTLPAGTPYAGKYELQLGACTGRDDLDVRKETGYSLIGLFQEVQEDAGLTLTVVCVVAWLVRRKQFAHLTFDDVLNSVPWGSDFQLDIPDVPSETDPAGKAESANVTLAS